MIDQIFYALTAFPWKLFFCVIVMVFVAFVFAASSDIYHAWSFYDWSVKIRGAKP